MSEFIPDEGEVAYLYEIKDGRHIVTFLAHNGSKIELSAPDSADGWGELDLLIDNFYYHVSNMSRQYGEHLYETYGDDYNDLEGFLPRM